MNMTPEEVERFEKLTPLEKAEFVIKNIGQDEPPPTFKQLIIDFYEGGLGNMELQKGICQECGCTDFDACIHPDHGECSWTDENKNLCSHCANPAISQDPDTEGPQGIKKPIF